MLEVKDLKVYFNTETNPIKAVDGVSFEVHRGKTCALVGESGCGKSVSALSLARLLPEQSVRYAGGSVMFKGRSVQEMDTHELRSLRGAGIAYIYQEPASSPNPVF